MSNSCPRLCLKPSAVGITCCSAKKCLKRIVKGQDQLKTPICRLAEFGETQLFESETNLIQLQTRRQVGCTGYAHTLPQEPKTST